MGCMPLAIGFDVCEVLPNKETQLDSVLKASVGLLVTQVLLSGIYQNSRLPEGKQIFNINYIVSFIF